MIGGAVCVMTRRPASVHAAPTSYGLRQRVRPIFGNAYTGNPIYTLAPAPCSVKNKNFMRS